MAVDLDRIGKLHAGLVGTSGIVAYFTRWGEAGSLLLGGLVMGANFVLLRFITSMLVAAAKTPDKPNRAALGVAAVVVKFTLFLALVVGMFARLPIEGMSFAFGATMLLVACVSEAIRADTVLKGAHQL